MTSTIEKDDLAYGGTPIRVTVAASVAFNPGAFKKGIKDLMVRLGCGACFSGFDCRFQLQRDYLINPEAKVEAITQQAASSQLLNVQLDKEVSHDLKRIGDTIDQIHKRFGCAPCHSGLDILFRSQLERLSFSHGF